MRRSVRKQSEAGFIVTVELIFIVTIMVIGLLVGWIAVRDATVAELGDVAEAVGALDQGYEYAGTFGDTGMAITSAGLFTDEPDTPAGAVLTAGTAAAGDLTPVVVISPPPAPE